ncbi:MAG: 8-amino-7-oxononanoate synthase [Verrucomicrobia bacterium]|nr:8-amino-7-oxononanoate synthase [Verrucomicrobiota bacterium]
MSPFEAELQQRLTEIREKGLYRELRQINSAQGPVLQLEGREFLNFSSNDYLGLANEPSIAQAAIEAIRRHGAGSGASRLVSGSLAPHHELEDAIASFKGTQAALSFSSGYAAALGAICALMSKTDLIVIDKLVHASIVDAARLSGAKLRVFRHNDLNDLEKILRWADQRAASAIDSAPTARRSRILVVTESVFSMDGDFAPLQEIIELKDKFGAWLMVDEAHAIGLYGKHRRGRAEALNIAGQIEVQMGTLGKAIGASGGFIGGPQHLIAYLVNRARSFMFSTAPVPAAAAAATAAIRLAQSDEGERRRTRLFELMGQLRKSWPSLSCQHDAPGCPIIPLLIGGEIEAVQMASSLRTRGLLIPAIRYPTVPRGKARLRLTLTAAHTPEQISWLAAVAAELGLNP